jgi:RNA polymerase sigma factor (sigma-70 family)
MDMQSNNPSQGEPAAKPELSKILGGFRPLLEQWCVQASTERWGISNERFAGELARCAEAKFRAGAPSAAELQAYLSTLHLEDLALACGCADGAAEAWEYFVVTYRGYLRACAGVMLKRSASSLEAEELADSLFAELYGLSAEKRGSLLRYFHGRSTLKTWLRAVLAQRHVDGIREGRKFEEFGEDEIGGTATLRGATTASQAADPHRKRYLHLFTGALQTALRNLDARDAERLRMYYAEEKKLAEIGRVLGEHESSVSRHLEKVRRDLRNAVEEILRAGGGSVAPNGERKISGLSDAEIALCFEYAAEDAPIDLDKLFLQNDARGVEGGGTEI